MKFTPSWLKTHLDTGRTVAEIADAMTMAGLEVEHLNDPGIKLAAFSVARIVSAAPHPNADRLQVCQVETRDGVKEIVCGAPNARAGLTTIYAPIGAYVPGLGVTLAEKPVRGVVSNGMLCSARELELPGDGEGIVDLGDLFAVGASVEQVFGLEPIIDFEVTPNRPDWLGVAGIARDLAAAGVGRFVDTAPAVAASGFACPIQVTIDSPELCPVFMGRLIRGVRNGPSPAWLQTRLTSVGLRPISALVDVTNFLAIDRARPLHVYDAAKLVGASLHVRGGRGGEHGPEHLIALDGRTYAASETMCVVADAAGERAIGLGGVIGGASTGCSEATTEVFLEAAVFDPITTAQTGRTLSLVSDAQYRFARGVDTGAVRDGLERATALVLEICGGEASDVIVAGETPAAPGSFAFDPREVERLTGLGLSRGDVFSRLEALGFAIANRDAEAVEVTPPTWRRDVARPADLVEEVARLVGLQALTPTPLPPRPAAVGGVLTSKQARVRIARRAMAAMGWSETIGWSFVSRHAASLFGGGEPALVLVNPIASELDCLRPSALPGLIEAAARNVARGFPDVALFEIGPVFAGDRPSEQATVIAAVTTAAPARHWSRSSADPLFQIKADIASLLDALGAPVTSLQTVQGATSPWWRPGQSGRLQLGPKTVVAEFGALHPRTLKALDATGPLYAFELRLEALPELKRRALKTRAPLARSTLMPLRRDFAFVTPTSAPTADLVRAVAGADKGLIAEVRVFDVYAGPGVEDGFKSIALEVEIQPRVATLSEAEIEALSAKVIAAAAKGGARLRT